MNDRYALQQRLGAGTTGEVWAATDTLLERPVAIKFLQAVDDDLHRELFSAEARMLARLLHPGITALFDADLAETKCYLIMEYAPGRALADILRDGPLPLTDALAMALRILESLRYAHAQGVIHRDIKPDNVMITPDGGVKLTDFGFANLVTLLRHGSDLQLGTPAYMPPEQIHGQPTDERSDLYSFGVMLFEMLTGRLPFEADDPDELLEAHLTRPPASIRAYLPDAPLTLEHALNRLLAKAPADRYPAAEAVLNVLRPILARRQVSAAQLKLLAVNDTGPLLGRSAQQLALRQTWQQVAGARATRLAVITGPAGSGKTRLAADFLNQQAEPVFVGRADAYLYAPFAEMMSDISRRYPQAVSGCVPAQRAALTTHLPGLAAHLPVDAAPPIGSPQQQQIEFFETVRFVLEQLGPALLFLEDAAGLDDGSLALLRFLLRRGQSPLLVMAAARSDETAEAWWPAFEPVLLDLPPLSLAESRSYLGHLLGGAAAADAAEAVYRRSGGTPLFIEETARHMVDTGELVRPGPGELWRYQRRDKSGSLPPTLVNIFQRRLSRLSKIAQPPLAVAALIGPEFEFEVWTAALDGDVNLALNSLDEALAQRLITDQGADRYGFNPANLAGPLVDSLSAPRRRLLHRKIAGILQAQPEAEPARLAAHYQAAGQNDEAAHCWQLAGDRAAAVNSLKTAAAAYEQAAQLTPTVTIYRQLGAIYRQLGRGQPAIEALQQAAGFALDPALKAAILNDLAFVYWLYDQYRPAFASAKQALELPGAPPAAQAVSRSHLGMIAWLIGRLREAEQQCALAVQLLRRLPDQTELAAACNRLGLVYVSLGELDKAATLFGASLDLRTRLNDLWGQAFSRNNLAKVALERGDIATAERELHLAEQLFGRIDSQDGLMVVLANRGRLWLRQGESQAALPPLNAALKLAQDIGKWSSYGLGDIHLLLGEAHLALGDLAAAGAAITEALRLVEAAGNTEYIAGGLALRARLFARQGKTGEAAAALARARQLARQAGGQLLPGRVERLAGLGND